jgi:uncharacterized protein YjbI with pentapeptide repeats
MIAEHMDVGVGPRPVPTDIYARLDTASPAERAVIVERLLTDAPDGGLDLSARNGCRANLRGIVLRDTTLRQVNLTGADLREANLQGAVMGQANLEGALLEGAILQGADLAGANLRGTAMSEANLREALLEDADLRDAGLRFADLHDAALENANLRGADLWGATLEDAVLTDANLRDATLGEGSLRGADLSNADLRGATIQRMDLRGARLKGANLQGAALTGSDLTDAVLSEAELQGVDLSHCTLAHAHFSGVWFDKTRLRQDQPGGAIGEELARDYEGAAKGYLALERNFIDLGDSDAGGWAYGKRRRMQKLAARHNARVAMRARAWRTAARQAVRAGAAQLVEWVCDYGESIPRVLASILMVYLIYLVLYGLTGSVLHVQDSHGATVTWVTRDPRELAIFSLFAITTSGSPAVGLLPSREWVQVLTGTEAFLGIFLIGLLGFVAGNKIRR